MRILAAALTGLFALAVAEDARAAAQPIRIVPSQVVKVCAKRTAAPVRPAIVCAQNIDVSGGAPKSSYTFKVKTGATLPPGIILKAKTGLVTATKLDPPVPASGTRLMHITVTDGTASVNGVVTVQLDGSASCTCPALRIGGGFIPVNAIAGQPFGYTLPVEGPASSKTLSPVYAWSVVGTPLPKGLALDPGSGVLRGTPPRDAANHSIIFNVRVTEKVTNKTVNSLGPYVLNVK